MAPMATELATLRALTFRISSTPPPQLPQHVPAIAASLANCRTILSSPQASVSKTAASEASLALHKYRTLLSTLLQHRTAQGRWSAIVLIKATIEVGGWEALQKCLPWVRGLLGFLTKPDPPSSKRLCIITLTRIFLLTREYPTLIREITTPSLPTFVQSSLHIANAKASPKLLQTVLECFNQLLPRHPTIFRSYLKQLQPLLACLIAPTRSTNLNQEEKPQPQPRFALTSEISTVACQLHVQISHCAPKGASSEDWAKSLKSSIASAHSTANKVFRAVLEDWQSTSRERQSVNGHTLEDEVRDLDSDALGLQPWSGIFAGGERLIGLLELVKEHLACPTANSVYLNLGAVMDLTTRMLSLTVPASNGKDFQNTFQLNNQVSKEERENLWSLLPDVHMAAIELLLTLVERSQSCTLALDALIIDQLVWVFSSEKEIVQIRAACYVAMATLLKRSGTTLPKVTIDSLVPLFRACCDDLLPSNINSDIAKQAPTHTKVNGNSQTQTTANADSFLDSSKTVKDPVAGLSGLKEAASDLLPALLANIRAQYLSDSLRARLDRTAILTQHSGAMMASALNPPPSMKFGRPAASILPLMARSFPGDRGIESMLRPRMPVIRLGGHDLDTEVKDESEGLELEEDFADALENPTVENERFVGQELDTLLESAGQMEEVVQNVTLHNTPKLSIEDAYLNSKSSMAESQLRHEATSGASPIPDTTKRTLSDTTPSSPSKRVKTSKEEERMTPQPSMFPETVTTPDKPLTTSVVLGASSFTATITATITASTIPDLPEAVEPEAGGEDSDDDGGMIPLVLGLDTDDESE